MVLQVLFPSLDLNLSVAAHADGGADVRGVIQIRDERPPAVLVAEASGGQASCADIDRDGTGGFVEVAATFRNHRSGEVVPVVITALDHDLDVSGTYALSVRVGGVLVALEARVHIPPVRRIG